MSLARKHQRFCDDWVRSDHQWDELVEYRIDKLKDPRPETNLPHGIIDLPFEFGLTCAYAGDADHATSFFDCVVRDADRLIEENRFHDNHIASAGHPRHLACVLRDRAYARWLLTGELDRSLLEVSAGYQLEYVAEKTEDPKGRECQFAMTGILAAARSALCAGNLSYAAEILSDDLRFLWHHENERQFWHELIRRYPDYDDDFRDRFDAFFDLVRDPEFKEEIDGIGTYILTTILRLETGVIRRMYVLGQGLTDPIPPELVIADISY